MLLCSFCVASMKTNLHDVYVFVSTFPNSVSWHCRKEAGRRQEGCYLRGINLPDVSGCDKELPVQWLQRALYTIMHHTV